MEAGLFAPASIFYLKSIPVSPYLAGVHHIIILFYILRRYIVYKTTYITRTEGTTELVKDKFVPVKNDSRQKPAAHTCLWACEYTPGEEFVSAWDEFRFRDSHYNEFDEKTGKWVACLNPDFSFGTGILFTLKDSARVYIVDSSEDFRRLLSKYERKDTPYIQDCLSQMETFFWFALENEKFEVYDEAEKMLEEAILFEEASKNPPYRERLLDFEAMAEDFDALFVSRKALLEMSEQNDGHLSMWDIPSLLVFNFDAVDGQWPLED